jgi:hypothetical protein
MGLLGKPPSWGYCSHNVTGTPSITIGTALTKSATANLDVTPTALLTDITHDVEYLILSFTQFASSNVDNSGHVDIVVDWNGSTGGTSWDTTDIIIPDLCVGGTMALTATAQGFAKTLHFPIWLPAGCTIGARWRGNNTTASTGYIQIYAFGGNKNPASWWCGRRVLAIGTTAGTSSGTSHTAGNTGAWSSWTNFGSATAANAGAVQFTVQPSANGVTSIMYRYEFGVSSTAIGAPVIYHANTNEQYYCSHTGPLFTSIPSGTQLQVRGTASGTAVAMEVAAYIVV